MLVFVLSFPEMRIMVLVHILWVSQLSIHGDTMFLQDLVYIRYSTAARWCQKNYGQIFNKILDNICLLRNPSKLDRFYFGFFCTFLLYKLKQKNCLSRIAIINPPPQSG